MSKNVDHMTQNVKGETENMKSKFSDLQQNLSALSKGGLFEQIDAMVAELKRLTDLTDKYEIRYFLLCAELERRARVIEEAWSRNQSLEETLKRKESEFAREIDRIRTEEVTNLRRTLETQLNNIKESSAAEKSRLERRIQELQADLTRKDNEIEDLKQRLSSSQDTINKYKYENQDLHRKNEDLVRDYENQITKIKNENHQYLINLNAQHSEDMINLRKKLEDEKMREIEKNKTTITTYYTQQLNSKDQDVNLLYNQIDQLKKRIEDLERENNSLHSQLDQKVREASDLKDQLINLKRSHEDYIIKITETHRNQLQKTLFDKDKEFKDRLDAELARVEKELKDKKTTILNLEQRIIHMEKEIQRTNARLNDMTVERDELKSKLQEAEKRLDEEMRVIEETLTIQIEERESEIDRLKEQIRVLTEMYTDNLDQEKGRVKSLEIENEMLRKEIEKLQKLSEQRNREIEDWKTKYKGYVTGEE